MLNKIKGAKGGDKQRKAVETPDSLFSIANARIVDLVSEGEIEGFPSGANFLRDIYLDETPIENADGTRNFKSLNVDARTGTQSQEYIAGFPAVENEIAVGIELTAASPWVRSFTNKSLSAVRVRVSIPALSKTNVSNGDITGHKVEYAIDVATDGGAYVEVTKSAFNGKSTSLYERSHRVDLPISTVSGWLLRVRRITADDPSATVQDTTSIASVTEIIDGKFRYPMSAVVGIQIDASQFQSIPVRAYRLKGRRIKVPVNYDPVTRVYTGVWDGTFKTAYSNNPAWVFYDMATHKRYGLGRLVSELEIDKYSLYAIGQYCDQMVPDGFGGTEPRMVCNLYLQQASDAWKVMGDLASIFRGICYWAGGSIVPTADRPSDPVYTYTNANVVDGVFSYQSSGRRARHTAVIVSYNDMTDYGRLKSDYYDDPEMIARFGFQLTEVVALGSTSRGQAQRVAKWLLLTEKLLTNTCSWNVGMDGTFAAPGQIVRVADKWRAGRRTGGRISAAALNSVTLDVVPSVAPVVGDTITVILPTGVSQTRTISAVAGRVITPSVNFTAIPTKESVWAIESASLKNQLFRVLSVSEGDNGTYGMTGIQHNASIFDAVDLGEPISIPPTSVVASATQARPATLTITSVERAGQVITMPLLSASWSAATGAVKYKVQWRKDNGAWSPVQEVHSTTADYQTPFPGVYEVKVEAINAIGMTSIPKISDPYTLTDQTKKPGFTDAMNAQINSALTKADNAQATADGAIVSFWQTTAPVIGTAAGQAAVGDLWFDTDDGNKVWRVVGTAWVRADDDDMAQAINAATTAQATADGKVKTFFQATAPAATGIGDLWFNTSADVKRLFRWNGSTWSDEILASPGTIGGRNYVNASAASNKPVADNSTSTLSGKVYQDANAAGNGYMDFVISPKLKPNTTYAISFMAWSVNGGSIEVDLFPDTLPQKNFIITPTPTRYEWLGVSSPSADMGTAILRFFGMAAGNGAVLIGDPKIEAGDRSTAWQPNPVEVDSSIANALTTAQNAQATADGAVISFWQPGAPVIGAGAGQASVGDLWFDTDDGNKIWRVVGSAWVRADDDDMAQAIAASTTAQATADGKVKTFFQDTAPTASGLGDLWWNGLKKELLRWNGSAWVTAVDIGVSLTGMGNLLTNTEFDPDLTGWYKNGEHANGQMIRNLAGASWQIIGTNNLGIHVNSLAVSGSETARNSSPYPSVIAGNTYIFSVWAASHRCSATAYIGWYNSAGANLGYSQTNSALDINGGQTFAGHQRIFVKAVAPAGAVYADIFLRAFFDGRDTPYAWFTRPMLEEVSPNQMAPSPWNAASVGVRKNALDALANAATAQATADGATVIYRQAGLPAFPPAAIGDYWIDTADNNKPYIATTGNVWTLVVDPRIAQGLSDAAAAQTTANGRIKTWYQNSAPAAAAIGDMWYNTNTQVLLRWDGGAWVSTADRTDSKVLVTITNPSFESAMDGWIDSIGAGVAMFYTEPTGFTGGLRLVKAPNAAAQAGLYNIDGKIPVKPSGRYRIRCAAWNNFANGTYHYGLAFYDQAGGYLGGDWSGNPEGGVTSTGNVWKEFSRVTTAPANSAFARIAFNFVNQSAGYWFLDSFGCDEEVTNLDEVVDGGNHGKVLLTDLNGNRIGLRVAGSGHRIGDQRNLPASNTTAYGAVRTATALTAYDNGSVTVNAHTIRYGGVSISYNGVANAVGGLAAGQRYVIYCIDPGYGGGSPPWYGATSRDIAMQQGDGVMVAGEVVIPTAGAPASGGGGGGGFECVDSDMILPCGTRAGDVVAGDYIWCWNEDAEQPDEEPVMVLRNSLSVEESTLISTGSGAWVIASNATPMTLRDGSICLITEMLDKEVLVRRPMSMRWERVVSVEDAGIREVAHISVGGRCYFAGETERVTISTHNAIKP